MMMSSLFLTFILYFPRGWTQDSIFFDKNLPVIAKEYTWTPADPLPTIQPEAKPFWKTKEKVYQKMSEGKELIVSVKEEKSLKPNYKLRIYLQGAGIMEVPPKFAFEKAKDFKSFPKMSSFVKEVQYDATRQLLYFHSAAFGYHARMFMQIAYGRAEKHNDIQFRVFSGDFKGMTGVVRIEDHQRRRSEISIIGDYNYDKLPIPKFFVEFGMEVALKQMAARMRAFVEESYKNESKNL